MNIKFHLIPVVLFILIISCKENEELDNTKPELMVIKPAQCAYVDMADSILEFEADVSDDVELKSYKIDIHNNFDHHTHGTDNTPCDFSPDKPPVNPWLYNSTWDLSGQKTSHINHQEILIPLDVDTGDYHMMVYVTDKSGNQSWKAIGFKLVK